MADDTNTAERDAFEAWHLATYPQHIARHGDTYKNAHVRCRWQGFQAARASLAASAGSEPVAADPMLLKFYGVTTDAELIAAQAAHIERLQAKLPQDPSFAPQRVREG